MVRGLAFGIARGLKGPLFRAVGDRGAGDYGHAVLSFFLEGSNSLRQKMFKITLVERCCGVAVGGVTEAAGVIILKELDLI